jgi:UDP-N-acetylglucosamine:LPS N-acetylglucosamine transferase
MKKILAVASVGGHWVQLLRLKPAFENTELCFMTTKQSFANMVPGHKFYVIPDFNRNDKIKIISSFFMIFSIIRKERPNLIITTGAAPGLMALFAGKLLGVKTVWVDSIANVDKLSLSGKIAVRIADRVYTQWPELADSKITFSGNVL